VKRRGEGEKFRGSVSGAQLGEEKSTGRDYTSLSREEVEKCHWGGQMYLLKQKLPKNKKSGKGK